LAAGTVSIYCFAFFVVMPNHIHAIIEIDDTIVEQSMVKIKSLSELIGAYKTTTSKQIILLKLHGQIKFFQNLLDGSVRFMIILSEMKKHYCEFQIIFKTILLIGKKINFIHEW
jgi:hypothetical protein